MTRSPHTVNMDRPFLRQVLDQRQTLRQEQIMAPQQIQSLEILAAAIPELEQRIEAELVENPTLELLEVGSQQLAGNPVEGAGTNGSDPAGEPPAGGKLEVFENLIKLDELWADRMPTPALRGNRHTAEDEERRQFFFDSLVAEPSLQEVLLQQLRQAEVTDELTSRLCKEIIGSIDDKGYLRTHVADIAMSCGITDLKAVDRALKIVQEFDPPGIGARDLRECLLLQLDRQPGGRKRLECRIADRFLEEIGRNKRPLVARALNVSLSELDEGVRRIRRLHPYPGSLVTPPRETDFIAPEVFVERDEQEAWVVRSNRDYIPRLRISPYYLKLLKDERTTDEVKNYIRRKIGDSKLLLRALEQRESTIVRITRSLLDFQAGFFGSGVDHMKPLTMSQVADDIEVHETTVSRAIANKYVQTPHGLFAFKHFFSSGYERADGQQVSSLAVKERLRELVGGEETKRPLSDQRLAGLLKKQGFKVARRTVAKYREELGILPSNMRRSF